MCYFSETSGDIQSTSPVNPAGKFLLPVFPKGFPAAAALLEMAGQCPITMQGLCRWMPDSGLAHVHTHKHTHAHVPAHTRSCKGHHSWSSSTGTWMQLQVEITAWYTHAAPWGTGCIFQVMCQFSLHNAHADSCSVKGQEGSKTTKSLFHIPYLQHILL